MIVKCIGWALTIPTTTKRMNKYLANEINKNRNHKFEP